MALTSPDNIYSPNIDDNWAVPQAMGALADSVQEALNDRANAYIGTSQERRNFTPDKPGTRWQDTDNGQFEFVWRGGRWQGIARVYTGNTMITPVTNSPTSVRVNFPTGFFTQTPSVSATANTSVPGSSVIEVGAAGPSVSGFDATIYRTNTTPTHVYWIAAQYPEP